MTSFLRALPFLACLPVAGLPLAAAAQQPATATSAPADSLFQRAARLVREGQGDAGRALVDSLLASTPDGDPAYGEALYWRAALATSAAAAERDYKRVIVEYPASPRAEAALITLAQLELARGDRERALAHLQRLQVEHPASPQRARAAVWAARAWFDLRDAGKACAAVADARAAVNAGDIELRNQVEFLSARCPVAASTTATAAATATSPASGDGRRVSGDSAPPAPRAVAPDARRQTPDAGAVGGRRFSIQVAAYDTRRDAEALVARLKKRGHAARVVGEQKPFRVRIGAWRTQGEASVALRRLKAAGVTGFITEGESP